MAKNCQAKFGTYGCDLVLKHKGLHSHDFDDFDKVEFLLWADEYKQALPTRQSELTMLPIDDDSHEGHAYGVYLM